MEFSMYKIKNTDFQLFFKTEISGPYDLTP